MPTMHSQGHGVSTSAMMPSAERRDRWRSAVEVTSLVLLLAAQIWLVWEWLPISDAAQKAVRVGLMALLIILLAASFIRSRDSRKDLGFSLECLKSGWGSLAVFVIISLLGLVISYALLPDTQRGNVQFKWLWTYTHGMVGQQLGLQYVLNNRTYRALGGWREPTRTIATVTICTAVFTLLHAPNPGLMLAVIPASAFWCWHFRRYHNLPALMVSHLLLGGASMVLLGDGPLLRLRVGPPAWRLLEAS